MLEPSLSQLMKHIDTRYLLVNVAANRAHRIAEESERQSRPLTEKAVKLAIEDIAAGRLRAKTKPLQPHIKRGGL